MQCQLEELLRRRGRIHDCVRGGLAAEVRAPQQRGEALRGDGVAELAEELDAHRAFIEAEGTLVERRRRNLRSEVISICTHRMRRDLERRVDEDERFSKLFDAVVSRELDPASAATEILEQLGD